MAPGKLQQKPATMKHDIEEVSESSSHFDDASEHSNGSSSSDSESESDSLDSQGSRKRRKFSPSNEAVAAIDDEDDDEDEPAAPVVAQPTRVKSRIKSKETKSAEVDADILASIQTVESRILAPVDPQTSFASLGVKPWLVSSLSAMAIKRPTGIQKGCIPEIIAGRDCIGGSRTGSGKTVAFAVPILQQWAADPFGIFALILTPTRELALQIYEQIKAISSPQSLKAVLITGGSDMRPQAADLARRPHIVIATPGRLADHIRQSGEDTVCGLRRVRMVVLDEADRLLESEGAGSMLPDVEECLSVLPPASKRQTLLFTATVTPEVRALRDMPRTPGKPPVFVCEIDTQALAIPPSLNQLYLQVTVTHREHYLHMFLLTEVNLPKSAIIFCNRKSTADYLSHLLRLLNHRVTALHGNLPQRQRIDNLGRFRASAARILVATDVAARGLDIPEVGLVINYDIPRDADDYIHRVGRTARAGRKGTSVTFVGQRDVELVLTIEQRVGRKMDAWEEEGVNLDKRVMNDALKVVSEKKREALLEIEEGREVGGKRKRGMKRLK